MRRKIAAVVAVAGLLVGCSTAAQRQYDGMVSNAQSASQRAEACGLARYNSPDFAPLRPHIPVNWNRVTLEQLADTHLATDEEIHALLAVHPSAQACRQDFLNQIALTAPSMVPIWASLYAKSDDSLVDLIQKKQSWGDHLRRVRSATAEEQAQQSAEEQRLLAGLNQSHQAEIAQRQAAANAMSQYLQTQQIINNLNRPVTTNCVMVGSQVICRSQ